MVAPAGHRRADTQPKPARAAQAAVLGQPHRPIDRQQREKCRGQIDREEVRDLDRQHRKRQQQRGEQADPSTIQSTSDQKDHNHAQQREQYRPRAADLKHLLVIGQIFPTRVEQQLQRFELRNAQVGVCDRRAFAIILRAGRGHAWRQRKSGVSITAVMCVSVWGSRP